MGWWVELQDQCMLQQQYQKILNMSLGILHDKSVRHTLFFFFSFLFFFFFQINVCLDHANIKYCMQPILKELIKNEIKKGGFSSAQ